MPAHKCLGKCQPACFLAQPSAKFLELSQYHNPLYCSGRVSDSVGLGWGLQADISNKSPGKIDAVGSSIIVRKLAASRKRGEGFGSRQPGPETCSPT